MVKNIEGKNVFFLTQTISHSILDQSYYKLSQAQIEIEKDLAFLFLQ